MSKKDIVQKNSENNKSILKRIFFRKIYLEILSYILILIGGVTLNAIIQVNIVNETIQLITKIFVSILVCLMMFFLGYICAKKREGIYKYLTVFCLMLIFGILTILRVFLNIIGLENILITYIIYANNIFIESSKVIFEWIQNIVKIDIGYIGVMITLIMIFLGNRKNIMDIEKRNIKGE